MPNKYQQHVPRDRVDYLNTLLEQAVKTVANLPQQPYRGGFGNAIIADTTDTARGLAQAVQHGQHGKFTPTDALSIAAVAPQAKAAKIISPSIANTTLRRVTDLLSHEGAPDRARVEFYKKWLKDGNETSPLRVMKEAAGWGVEDGKHRLQAYKELGHKFVPTVDVANLSDDAKRAIDRYDDYLQRHARKLTK